MGEIIDFNKAFAQKKNLGKNKSISKKKPNSSSLMVFKVSVLESFLNQKSKQKIYRVLSIPNLFTLSEFAEAILDSFDFELDHLYGFYSNIENWAQSDEFYSMEEDEIFENCSGYVSQVTVSEVFKIPNKKMLFLFDFGDEWKFMIEYLNQESAEGKGTLAATIIESVGEAPPQYPDFEA